MAKADEISSTTCLEQQNSLCMLKKTGSKTVRNQPVDHQKVQTCPEVSGTSRF